MSLEAARTELLGLGLGMPVVLGLTWLILLRFFARTIVWLSLFAVGAGLCLLTLYLFLTSGAFDDLLGALVNATGSDPAYANLTAGVATGVSAVSPPTSWSCTARKITGSAVNQML